MARIITKELAQKIAKKLDAVLEKSGAHMIAYIFHNHEVVAAFGIRHGSAKDQGHDHVPELIHLRPNQAKRLGQCPMSKEEWIARMVEIGVIPPPEPPGA